MSLRIFLLVTVITLVAGGSLQARQSQDFRRYEGWQVSRLKVNGLPRELRSSLQNGLLFSGETKLLRRRYPVFRASLFQQDLDRVGLFLARNGYPRARITPRFQPDAPTREVAITLDIDLGAAILVESVRLEGFPPETERETRRVLEFREGSVFTDAAVEANATVLLKVLMEHGYAKAAVTPRVEPGDSSRVTVVFVADPKEIFHFGRVTVSGMGEDLAPLAHRSIDIKRGEIFSPETLERAHDNLRILNLFRKIRITTEEAVAGTLDVEAELAEREPRTVETSLGYWSEDKLRAKATWQHRNTFGGGRGLSFLLSYSQFLQQASTSAWWPALLGPRTRELLILGGRRESEDNYTQWSVGGELATLYRRSFRTTYRLGLNLGWIDVDEKNPEFAGAKDGWMTYLVGGWNWDTSNDRLFPRSGAVTWINLEYSPPLLSANEYVRSEIGSSFYFPLFRKAVFATRGWVGHARPLGQSTTLIPGKRFFAGGVNTNRGFNRRRLGPKDQNGDPLGGQVMLLTLTEVRVPVVWKLWGAIFLDIGQVWRLTEDVNLSQLEPAIGPALMVQSPVGPIRFDYGFRLKGADSEPGRAFHFMIGNPF